MEGSDRQVLRFLTTAKASADAHALSRVGLAQFDFIVDIIALVFASILLLSGFTLLGVAVVVIAVLSLAGSRFHPVERGLIALRFHSVLGRMTEVTITDEGLRFANPLGSSFIPWSSINAVKSNGQTVAFFRDRVLLGYIPASAFDSSEAQANVVALARSRIQPIRGPRT